RSGVQIERHRIRWNSAAELGQVGAGVRVLRKRLEAARASHVDSGSSIEQDWFDRVRRGSTAATERRHDTSSECECLKRVLSGVQFREVEAFKNTKAGLHSSGHGLTGSKRRRQRTGGGTATQADDSEGNIPLGQEFVQIARRWRAWIRACASTLGGDRHR